MSDIRYGSLHAVFFEGGDEPVGGFADFLLGVGIACVFGRNQQLQTGELIRRFLRRVRLGKRRLLDGLGDGFLLFPNDLRLFFLFALHLGGEVLHHVADALFQNGIRRGGFLPLRHRRQGFPGVFVCGDENIVGCGRMFL